MAIMRHDRVVVVLRENVEGASGRPVPREVGRVDVVGRMHESTTNDVQDVTAAGVTGAFVLTMKRFTCRSFPGDDLSQVIDASGVVYDVVGEPKRYAGSRRTQRDSVYLRATSVKRGTRG